MKIVFFWFAFLLPTKKLQAGKFNTLIKIKLISKDQKVSTSSNYNYDLISRGILAENKFEF